MMRRSSRPPPALASLVLVALATTGMLGAGALVLAREVGAWALLGLLLTLVGLGYLVRGARAVERRRAMLRRERDLHRLSLDRDREREELAAVLHDDISPRLVALGYQLDRARRSADAGRALEAAGDAARAAQRRVRAMIARLLRQPHVSGGDDEVIDRIADEVGTDVRVVRYFDPEVTGTPAAELLLGVAREALRNAVRHGRAERVDMVLRRKGKRAVLIVSDDGRGFDPATAGGEGHYGLTLLRRRIESTGGTFSLVSAPEHGTVVTCEIPLAEPADADRMGGDAERDVSRGGG